MRPLTMRVPLGAALLGTVLSMNPAGAQSAPEQAPAPESHHWHSHSLFEGAPPKRSPPADVRCGALGLKNVPQRHRFRRQHETGEEFALIRVGSTEKEVLAVLGPPSSQVVVPDDDGHLRESLQYWVKGSPMGTVRLDNGRVVQIETKPK